MLSFKPIFNLYIDITDYFSTKVKYRYIIQSNRYIILRSYIPDISCIVFKLISIIRYKHYKITNIYYSVNIIDILFITSIIIISDLQKQYTVLQVKYYINNYFVLYNYHLSLFL